jgi:hypothetical protein
MGGNADATCTGTAVASGNAGAGVDAGGAVGTGQKGPAAGMLAGGGGSGGPPGRCVSALLMQVPESTAAHLLPQVFPPARPGLRQERALFARTSVPV